MTKKNINRKNPTWLFTTTITWWGIIQGNDYWQRHSGNESVEQTDYNFRSFNAEKKLLPDVSPKEQYQFARNFWKLVIMIVQTFREFVLTNPDNELSGNAQYWYAETYRIRQMYTDAATAYLEDIKNILKVKLHQRTC